MAHHIHHHSDMLRLWHRDPTGVAGVRQDAARHGGPVLLEWMSRRQPVTPMLD